MHNRGVSGGRMMVLHEGLVWKRRWCVRKIIWIQSYSAEDTERATNNIA